LIDALIDTLVLLNTPAGMALMTAPMFSLPHAISIGTPTVSWDVQY
jgi:hypothetical protein